MTTQREKALLAFKKARGQVDKLVAMTEEGKYCMDIMQQNLAAIGLLKSAHQLMLEGHLNSCFKDPKNLKDGARMQTMIQELSRVVKMYNK